jgi:secondary thiamine-phosphate synthase enzyme
MLRYINVSSSRRNEFIDITGQVESMLAEAGVKDGVCYIYVPHTTAGVTINEGADPVVRDDILDTLERLVPVDRRYRHLEGNSDSHVKSSLVGVTLHLPVSDGRLVLGTWQSIFFCEFDGPRSRKAAIKFISG